MKNKVLVFFKVCVFALLIWLLFILLCLIPFIIYSGKVNAPITNFAEYQEKIAAVTSDLHSNLLIFPENVPEEDVVDYGYFQMDGLLDGCYLIYLSCNYDQESYDNEVERISQLSVTLKDGTVKTPLYSETGFYYPAYITIFDGYDSYEYALLDGDQNRIIYLCHQILSYDELPEGVIIPSDYLPQNYEIPENLRDEARPGYCMYY